MKYQKAETIYKEISNLSNGDKIIILSKLMVEVSKFVEIDRKTNIYDIKGVGKEIWAGMDAQDYVNKERESWD